MDRPLRMPPSDFPFRDGEADDASGSLDNRVEDN